MIRGRLAPLIAALLICGAASAEDAQGRYAVKGMGQMPCSSFTDELEAQSEEARRALAWIAGYLTAINAESDRTFDIVSWQSEGMIARALDARCRSNPGEPLAAAVEAMVATMRGDRITEEDELTTVRAAGRERVLYGSVIRRLQASLEARGEDVVVSGRFDDATRGGLRRFQRDEGLAVTGFPDSLTLFRLFGGPDPAR